MKYQKEKIISRDLGRFFSSHTLNRGLWNSSTNKSALMAKSDDYCTEIWREGFSYHAWMLPKLLDAGHGFIIGMTIDLVEPVLLQPRLLPEGTTIFSSQIEGGRL